MNQSYVAIFQTEGFYGLEIFYVRLMKILHRVNLYP
ncbi:MAG: hypothetical protein H6Q73_4448 [Firmicutes bacterium]|nr:hypothetical protein [Bacillota bacterium]